MRSAALWAVVAAAFPLRAYAGAVRDYNAYDYYALHLDSYTSPGEIASHLGLQHEGPLASLPDHHVFRTSKGDRDIVHDAREELKRRRFARRDLDAHILDGILLTQKQQARQRLVKRSVIPSLPERSAQQSNEAVDTRNMIAETLSIKDPIFNEQWHIFNTEQVGHDLNVTGVWLQGITGKNATVCIIDDGLDMDSLDLADNYFAAGSYDFNEGVDEPKPRLADDQHGTRCAGEVAAVKNDVCGVGVAYGAHVSGVRILSKPISDVDEAESMMYAYQNGNDIFSCSWGPPDDGKTMDAPGILVRRAISKAVQEGRGGLGTIYVFAAGNGASNGDNCNFDGYTNSIDSITVGAIDKTDHHPYYSEMCSAQLVVTYSSGAGDSIHTTDVGRSKCTSAHGGTSAAGPLAAGVYALVLSVRPDLSWRDLQWLTVMNAVSFDAPPNDWQDTATGRKFSHQYGYGKLDAYAIVEAAKTWQTVDKQAWYFAPWVHIDHPIPEGELGIASTFEVTADMLQQSNLKRLEHVTVSMNVEHQRRGDLSVELKSPTGVSSHIAVTRTHDEATTGYANWTFMSVAHFGESGVGEWSVIVKDTNANGKTGTFIDWRLKLFGEALDGATQPPLPLPEEGSDTDAPQVTAVPSTTSISVAPPASTVPPPSSAHPTRPAIAKPPADSDAGSDEGTAPPDTSGTPDGSFLPSPFPTFGVSKRTQIWIYGAVALILAFVAALAVYYVVVRRRRARNARDDYAFEMVGDDDDGDDGDADADADARGRRARKGRRGRRAGELYDAFAGESDEDSLLSGGEEAPYRDRVEAEGAEDEDGGSGAERGRR